jgi:hypothetical protein
METINDSDVWEFIDPNDLWIYDKLIIAKKLGYYCGPAGTQPKKPGSYVVRPCVNFLMMGHGAKIEKLYQYGKTIDVPIGYFWCEMFTGPHISYDYNFGKQVLAVEGFKDDPERLDRFSKWKKVDSTFAIPPMLEYISKKYTWLNIETIGGKIIEVHLRYNDDFCNHDSDEIIPVWKDKFYRSECGDRLGFIVKNIRP